MNKFKAILVSVTIFAAGNVVAQESDPGRLSGSFETNTIYYVPDRPEAPTPDDRFGSNNYLKLDYTRGRFAVGVQYELYAPVLQGFNPLLKDGRITNKYVSWTDDNFSVTVGDFYEQFGNGLILRSYEDRALAFNNSLEGVRATYSIGDIFTLKGLWARPRLYMEYADSWVRGLDASLSISSLAGMTENYLALEGSYVNRYQTLTPELAAGRPTRNDVGAWSGRFMYEGYGFSARAEIVDKGPETYVEDDEYVARRGSAQFVEVGYNNSGLGILATFRRLNHMGMKINDGASGDNNVLNYLPSLTRQYTYLLTNLQPYTPESESSIGEQGGQLDVFYNFRRGSALGGKYGMKLHLNGSIFYPIDKVVSPVTGNEERNMLYSDFSVDVEKQFSRKFKLLLMASIQSYNPHKGATNALDVRNVFVADMTYRATSKTSLRLELQYLYSAENSKDWMAALAEVNFAPRWSIFVSDMYNHGASAGQPDYGVHYYNAGVSYSHSRTRVALSYGRNKAGYVCSGGVCRVMPEYTGANISITTSF